MGELFQAAIAPHTLLYTLLLGLALLYWLTVFVGVLDISSVDFDVDIDADVDVDADVDADTAAGSGGFLAVLSFFNLGKVPFMLFFSFLTLSLWVGSILFHHYLAPNALWYWTAIWFIPNLLIALFITKACTQGLAPVFADEKNEFETHEDVVGRIGLALLPLDDKSVGQVRVDTQGGAPLLLRVRAAQGQKVAKGQKVLVVFYDQAQKVYLGEPYFD